MISKSIWDGDEGQNVPAHRARSLCYPKAARPTETFLPWAILPTSHTIILQERFIFFPCKVGITQCLHFTKRTFLIAVHAHQHFKPGGWAACTPRSRGGGWLWQLCSISLSGLMQEQQVSGSFRHKQLCFPTPCSCPNILSTWGHTVGPL